LITHCCFVIFIIFYPVTLFNNLKSCFIWAFYL